jgi:hypothetical protein
MKSYGQLAYEVYVEHCGGVSIHGEALPSWEGLRPEIKGHWDAAAQAVESAVIGVPE